MITHIWISLICRLFYLNTKDDGNDGGVKADDIWNKFVSDDQDVVRAPTAQTKVSVSGGSQRSQLTGGSHASGKQPLLLWLSDTWIP